MAMPYKGQRVALTIRLPIDDYREVAIRAKARGWSMSDYVNYCVGVTTGTRKNTRVGENPVRTRELVDD